MKNSQSDKRPPPEFRRFTRRHILEVGSVSAFGLTSAHLLSAAEPASATAPGFGRARSCVVIFLWGGPGQQDLWDPKPEAPSPTRSEFPPISTTVSGIQITDQLPKLARQASRFTIVRSVTHRDFEHGSAAYTALTGQPHPLPGTNTTARPDDFPTYGAIVQKLAPTSQPVPDFVVLGPVMHQGARPPLAGQNAGFLGAGFDAFRIPDDPSSEAFAVEGLSLQHELSPTRLAARRRLLTSIDLDASASPSIVRGMDELYGRAFGMLGSTEVRRALSLSQERDSVRDAYGRSRFGQTMLLARRLVEARVPLVTVNWSKLNADQWDTHKNNFSKLRELLPPFDQGLAAFLQDLDAHGLLDSTLVVGLGEFGRTPKINENAGRDHWPDCYSLLLAGGGISGGRVFGASNRTASYPIRDDVAPWDVAATIYHLLGIAPGTQIRNRQGQPLPIARGQVISGLL